METKQTNTGNSEHYESLNGLRTFAALGIIAMHIAFNIDYNISIIRSSNIFYFFNYSVFLFMIISGFGMCCGYYEKISSGSISISQFYEKRYAKIWPYFALLVIFELIMDFSVPALTESFANLTLAFSLLPNPKIGVIGVGWTIGVIFLFYMLFPFFCFLLKTKLRAWFALVISVIYNIACQEYFFDTTHVFEDFRNRESFIFCAMFFLAGGVIYLYRDNISSFIKKFRWAFLVLVIFLTGIYLVSDKIRPKSLLNILLLLIFSTWLMYAIGVNSKLLNNKFTRFFSNISMEVYLCHMIIFGLVKKLNLIYLFKNEVLSFIAAFLIVLIGSVVFALVSAKVLECIRYVITKWILKYKAL